MVILLVDLKTGRVLKLYFVGEEADVISISSFKHHITQSYYFDIKVVVDVVHLKRPISYSVIYVFENTKQQIEMCSILC